MFGWLWTAHNWFSDNFLHLGASDTSVTWLEKMVRPVAVYFFLVVCLRVFGKRELAQLNPFDLVVLLSLANTVQNAIIGNDMSLTGGFLGAFSLLTVNYFVVRFFFKHRRLDQLLEGSPTVLIANGRIQQKALAHELLTEAELLTVAHRQGFAGINEIECCVLEPGGTFYIEGKEPRLSERQHAEVMAQLAELHKQIALLQGQIATWRG